MIKTKKTNTAVFIGVLITSFFLYLFTEFICTGSCYVKYEREYLDPLLFGLLGLVPTIGLLLFFSEKIFISWVKYILWWFILLILWAVPNLSGGGVIGFSEVWITGACMAILFTLSLIYALVMNGKMKEESTT